MMSGFGVIKLYAEKVLTWGGVYSMYMRISKPPCRSESNICILLELEKITRSTVKVWWRCSPKPFEPVRPHFISLSLKTVSHSAGAVKAMHVQRTVRI